MIDTGDPFASLITGIAAKREDMKFHTPGIDLLVPKIDHLRNVVSGRLAFA
jgi:hypothetical protein